MGLKSLVGIYGASGFGVETMPIARECAAKKFGTDCEVVFIDDAAQVSEKNGHKVVCWEDFLAIDATAKFVTIAIADSHVRETLFNKCKNAGVGMLQSMHDNVVVMDDVKIGPGAVISTGVTLFSNVTIGKGFHANLNSYVAHDCIIGDFVTFAPAVCCNGNVHIEDHAYIGTGALIKQGANDKKLTIGKGAVVGMGAVVTKSVPAGQTVVGNPAKPFPVSGKSS